MPQTSVNGRPTPTTRQPSIHGRQWALSTTGGDVALPDVSLSVSPATISPVRSTVTGGYASYFIENKAASITAVKTGFQSPPTLAMPVYPDVRADFLMQPLDNIVINGGFEASTHALLDWQTGGALTPILDTLDKHSGSQAALLGCPEMSRPSTVPSGGKFLGCDPAPGRRSGRRGACRVG